MIQEIEKMDKMQSPKNSGLDWNAVEQYKLSLEQYKKNKTCCSKFLKVVKTKWPHALLLVSISVLILVIIFKDIGLDLVVQQQVYQRVRLTEGTDTFQRWANITIPIFIKFHFFNISNFNEFERGGKPRLQQVGPYTYEEHRVKKITAIDKEQDTVSYRQFINYHFRRDLSVGDESDRAILINVPFVAVAKIAREMTSFGPANTITDLALRDRGERLFNRYTVREYLFDGFPVQSYVRFMQNPIIRLANGGRAVPESFNNSRFGFYKGRNNSDDGEFTVSTGTRVPQDFGKILSWDGKTRIEHWEGACNQINGTDGSIFHPFIKKTDILRFYTPELCRSLLLVYKEEVVVKNINAYRFQLPHPKHIFEHKEFCFCPPKPQQCLKQGVFSLSPCRDGAPVSFSAPHFFQSYEPYLNDVDGLNPNAAEHDTYVDIEPTTGLILRAVKRLQFNINIERNPNMQTFRQVRNVLLPFLWAEETAEIPDAEAEKLYQELYVGVRLANKACTGLIIGTSILIFIGILGCLFIQCSRKQDKPLMDLSDRESRSSVSSSGVVSVMSSASASPSLVSRGTNTSSSEHKGTMTDEILLVQDKKQ